MMTRETNVAEDSAVFAQRALFQNMSQFSFVLVKWTKVNVSNAMVFAHKEKVGIIPGNQNPDPIENQGLS